MRGLRWPTAPRNLKMPLSEYKVIRPAAVVADRVLVDLAEKGPTSESEKTTHQTNNKSRLNQAGDFDSHGANDRECTAGRRNGLGKANGFRLKDLALTQESACRSLWFGTLLCIERASRNQLSLWDQRSGVSD